MLDTFAHELVRPEAVERVSQLLFKIAIHEELPHAVYRAKDGDYWLQNASSLEGQVAQDFIDLVSALETEVTLNRDRTADRVRSRCIFTYEGPAASIISKWKISIDCGLWFFIVYSEWRNTNNIKASLEYNQNEFGRR